MAINFLPQMKDVILEIFGIFREILVIVIQRTRYQSVIPFKQSSPNSIICLSSNPLSRPCILLLTQATIQNYHMILKRSLLKKVMNLYEKIIAAM